MHGRHERHGRRCSPGREAFSQVCERCTIKEANQLLPSTDKYTLAVTRRAHCNTVHTMQPQHSLRFLPMPRRPQAAASQCVATGRPLQRPLAALSTGGHRRALNGLQLTKQRAPALGAVRCEGRLRSTGVRVKGGARAGCAEAQEESHQRVGERQRPVLERRTIMQIRGAKDRVYTLT